MNANCLIYLNEVLMSQSFLRNTIENNVKVPKKLIKAYEEGQEFNKNGKDDHKKCFKSYSWCPYSATTMMKFIAFNRVLFG
jgi:hypothetical protein